MLHPKTFSSKKTTTFAIGNKHKSIIWEIESKLYLRKTLRGKNESSLSLLSLTLFILHKTNSKLFLTDNKSNLNSKRKARLREYLFGK